MRSASVCQSPRRQSRLFCRYHDNNRHPRYVIGPVKEEDEWDRPRIVRYHDIVSDKEMAKVKELAKPRVSVTATKPGLLVPCVTNTHLPLSAQLRRATVHDPQTGKLTTAHYRVSKR